MNPALTGDWQLNWYCVRAKPRAENAAAQSIKAIQGVDVFFPKTISQRKKNAAPPSFLRKGEGGTPPTRRGSDEKGEKEKTNDQNKEPVISLLPTS